MLATLPEEDGNVYEPNIIFEDGVYKMWYSAEWETPTINYATSTDGLIWTKSESNPIVLDHNRSFVFKNGLVYYMYAANSANTSIDIYTSNDGIIWTLDTESVISVGSVETWDAGGIANLHVWVEATVWYMLYEAKTTTGNWAIGLATSADGRIWIKSESNPVISEDGSVGGPWVKKGTDGYYYLWCHRSISGKLPTDIYRYRSADLINWVDYGNLMISRETTDEGFGTAVGQLADVFVIESGNNMFVYCSASKDGTSKSAGQHIKLFVSPVSGITGAYP